MIGESNAGRLRQKVNAYYILFPMASIYGMCVLPASVYGLTTYPLLPGIATPMGHAHELLFGYTLAVASGFLLNRVPAWWVAGLLSAWLCARVTFLVAPQSTAADFFNILFALGFVLTGASRFLPAAKKWRNRVFGFNVVVLAASLIAVHVLTMKVSLVYLATHEAVLMFSLLMLLIGGRFIAPAAAGHIEKRGGTLEARVQPRLEASLIILLIAAATLFLLPGLDLLSGSALFACGCVATVRLIRWRLWACRDRADLMGLGAGYLWLSGGLMLTGASLFVSGTINVALHAITVGAIGTLTLTVMSRTWIQRSGDHSDRCGIFWLIIGLIALAAVLRLASAMVSADPGRILQLAASIAWAIAFLAVITFVFVRYPGRRRAGVR